ncbi:MAG: PQQ-dependent sugar dehydrogenase [Ferruginibacter sp.]|nr:PQQ-dependent sugar dehydrogenase [Ferruginibacter sp.]
MSKIFTPLKKTSTVLFACFALQFSVFINHSLAQAPTLIYDTIIRTGLSSPVDIVNAGDGTNRLFIVEQGGRIKILSGGALLPGNFLEIPDSLSTGGERGLLSAAFHPDYENNRYFFVYYTNTSGDITITRFQTQAGDPNAADEATGVVLLRIPKPFSNHNGGRLLFGPDGKLYFATGDGGSGGDPNNFAQNGNSLLGKMIRLDVDDFSTPPYYAIPADNPYVADPLVRDEIFAIGLRNPFRWSFDRLTNEVWIADVGQGAWEEINNRSFATSGGINYGWRCYEGNAAYNTAGCLPPGNYISPIFNYPHNFATGGFSVTGGHVYRGVEFPALFGYYICADYVSANTWLIITDGLSGWIVTQQAGLPGSIAGFGEAENGAMYAVGLNGYIYKIRINVVLPVTLKLFTAKAFNSYNEIKWETVNEFNIAMYEVEFSTDALNYQKAGTVNAINNGNENKYSFQHPVADFTKLFYRLKITENSGRITYSAIALLTKKPDNNVRIYPMPLTEDRCTIISERPIERVILYNIEGSEIFTRNMNNVSGTINISLPHLQNGVYIIKLKIKDEFINQKILVQH